MLDGLNNKQKEAALSKDKRVLVLAGAGSGKTRTIIQKITHLIFEEKVEPADILAITFTRNAANEMIDRLILLSDEKGEYKKIINNKKTSQKAKNYKRMEYVSKYPWLSSLTAKTFHGFCYSVLKEHIAKDFDNKFKIIQDKYINEDFSPAKNAPETSRDLIHKTLLILSSDVDFLLKLKRYILDHYVEKYRLQKNKEGYFNYKKPYSTLKGENVRSKSERYIADWLYAHDIDYEYEPSLHIKDFKFRPDFYIPEADLYIEHVSNISSPMKDKEEQFKEANKVIYKTYEQMTHDINQFHDALYRIISPRLNREISKISALKFENEFSGYHKELSVFIDQILKVIDKIKAENKNFEEIYEKGINDPHERIKTFFSLLKQIYTKYNEECILQSYLDYNDLLIKTISLFQAHEDVRHKYKNKYKYILVDEFQDVNALQVELINLLLSENTQLFCVGDDWQSIYGFRGSEVEYIVNFEKYFENSRIIKLDINYRSHDTIVNASNEVIKNNKYKIEKEIRSLTKSGKKLFLYAAKKEEEDGVEAVMEKLGQFLDNGHSPEDLLILYRRTSSFKPYERKMEEYGIKVPSRTIHAAKGLESKIVFLVGLIGGYYGFPNVWEEDRIFQIIKETNFELKMEEERRLFYVALTRAKEELFLITELGNESSFIKEIPGEFIDRNNFLILNINPNELQNQKCPSCVKTIEDGFMYCPYCGIKISNF